MRLLASHRETIRRARCPGDAPPPLRPAHERGAALIVSLLLAALLGAIALSAASGALLQQRAVGNLKFAAAAFHAADAGLRQAVARHRAGETGPFSGRLGDADFTVVVAPPPSTAGRYIANAVGVHPASGARRTLAVEIEGAPGGGVSTPHHWIVK